jgi:DNA-binding CsgD family transcriptional regulator
VTLLEVSPLSSDGVEQDVAACLDTEEVPHGVLAYIQSNSEGNPLLVEELLADLVKTGSMRLEQGQWINTSLLAPSVPFDFAESVWRRLAALTDLDRRVLRVAALFGRRFDWELVVEVAEVDEQTVFDALRAGAHAQVIAVEGTGFMFRHALTREAVLDELLPPERRELARRAWPAVVRAHADVPGPWCELAAELAEVAGESAAAASLLLESAGRALANGAFATAEAAATRAKQLAGNHSATGIDAEEVLVEALALAGKVEPATAVGRSLLDRLAAVDASADRRVDLLLVLTRAAVAGGDGAAASSHVDEARSLIVHGDLDAAVVARFEAVAAHVALVQGRLDQAGELAHSAVRHAAAIGRPDVECEALEVMGRVDRALGTPGSGAGAGWFERAAEIAERNELPGWLLRARHELAVQDLFRGRTERMLETRERAVRHGALITVAVMDLSLADAALVSFDRDGCLDAAERCVRASSRYRLATLPVACLWLAGAHALAGQDEEMEAAAERALEADPDDPRILGDLWGRVRATRSMVGDDRAGLRSDLDTMMGYVRVAPVGTSIFPHRLLWALVRTAEDDDHGEPARQEVAAAAQLNWWAAFRPLLDTIEIVAEGRQSPTASLTSRFNEKLQRVAAFPGLVQYFHLIAAEAAIRDGWGDPVSWLRQAEAFFNAGQYHLIARRCRRLLGEAGAPVPRRGRGESVVPPTLRALGITSRELDVLRLVTDGLSNREIAQRLFLSPKTVERHMANLFNRTGVNTRRTLADFARSQDQ